MANETLINPKHLESMVAVLRSLIEEQVVNTTYGATRFLREALETQHQALQETLKYLPSLPQMPEMPIAHPQDNILGNRVEQRMANLERLLDRVGTLVDQLDQRHGRLMDFEQRIAQIEQTSQQNSITPRLLNQQGESIVTIEERLARLERLIHAEVGYVEDEPLG
jgi:DNA repair ATPase RecN